MFAIQRAISIARPIGEVFAYIADFDHDREWRSEVQFVGHLSGEHPSLGECYEEAMHFPGFSVRSTFTVTEFEPPYRISAEGSSEGMRASQHYELAEERGGTRLTVTTRIETQGLLAMGQPIAVRLLRGRARENLRRLKRVLEGGSAGSAATG